MAAKYAQHFLTNLHAIERIVSELRIAPEDTLLEIGPGKGALTQHLVKKAARVVAIEVDPEMAAYLGEKLKLSPQLTLINKDFLEFDLSPLGPAKVVGNLPYNLTSPILRKLAAWEGWSEGLIMVQKEVGERLCAKPGSPEYGALTVGMSLNCTMEMVFVLSETSFSPPPRVKSAVVRLRRLATPLTPDIPKTQRVIQAAFQQRRKTIINSLSHGLQLPKETVMPCLEKLGITPDTRAERITVPQFVELAHLLSPSF